MISSKLKNHFIQKEIDRLRIRDHNNRVVDGKKINSVGIITSIVIEEKLGLQSLVTEKLNLRNPKIYTYRKYDKNDEKSYKHFSEKDFNWRGHIVDSSLLSFLEEPLDLLICFYPQKHTYLEYATIASQATFKIGYAGIHPGLFDLEISVKENQIDDFFSEIKKYLEILNKL